MDSYKLNNRLYWTTGRINELYYECIDPETGEMTEDFPERLEQLLRLQDENKDDAINEIKSRQAMIEARKAEVKRLQSANDRDTKAIEMLKQALSDVLEGEKYASPVGNVSYRHSQAVGIYDKDALIEWAKANDAEILSYADPTISKTVISKRIAEGKEIPFCGIEERVSVLIK